MRLILVFICSVFLSIFFSCNEDFDQTVLSNGKLTFSKDTIYLDTIFTNISSSTRTLKIFNKSNSNITIPTIKLGRGEDSFYRLNVDGLSGKNFQNMDILAKDSLYVFIEATVDFSKVTNPIYTDSIVFDTGVNTQDVKLVTLVQDAHFIFPQRNAQGIKETIILGKNENGDNIVIEGTYLKGDAVWTNDKPYVVYGYVGVNSNRKLIIEKGTKVHFHKNSGLLVEKDGTLEVNGKLGEEVIFEGDRLEPFFSQIAGQWGIIWLRAGSKNHHINYAIIKNNSIGILMDSIGSLTEPTLRIYNTQIYNTSSYGLLGRNTNIEGKNLVIANNAQSSLACTIGGTYNFTQATFANYWNDNGRALPTVLINNFGTGIHANNSSSVQVRDLMAANFTNCIMDGNKKIEFLLEKVEGTEFNYNFLNCLLKFEDTSGNFQDNPLYDFEDSANYQNNIFNGIADFKNIYTNEFIIGQKSDAIANANPTAAAQIPLDLLGISRVLNPDIGSYQHVIFEEN